MFRELIVKKVRADQRIDGFLDIITTNTELLAEKAAWERTVALSAAHSIILSLNNDDRLAAWQKMMAHPVTKVWIEHEMKDWITHIQDVRLWRAQDIIESLPPHHKLAMWQEIMASPAIQDELDQPNKSWSVIVRLGDILDQLSAASLREAGIVKRKIGAGDVEHDGGGHYSGAVYVVPHHLLPQALQSQKEEYQTIACFSILYMTAGQLANNWHTSRHTTTRAKISMAAMLRATADELAEPRPKTMVEELRAAALWLVGKGSRIIGAPTNPEVSKKMVASLRAAADAFHHPSA
ncbi:MAG: hypothetical protein EBZ69_07840 [Alphaproteobacteria bacterium]|nr:hypothetical protein [Alphaproteobacteria bacterium]NDC56700.1 hypothetical protein [Alphaproteobacteria bacterium]NDG04155.1 hypothetical protein [Alphaproteobacteria bacterium]